MDAGTIWFYALNNAGNSIGEGVGQAIERNQHLDSLMQFADMLGKTAFDPATGSLKMIGPDGTDANAGGGGATLNDPNTGQDIQRGGGGNGKTKGAQLTPILDPGFLNAFKQKTYGERMRSQGALEALLGMGTKLAYEGAKAKLRSQYADPYKALNYNLRLQGEQRREAGERRRERQELRIYQGQQQRELIARQKSVDAMLKPKGLDRNALFAFDQHKAVDSVGNSTLKNGAGIKPDETNYVGVPNNDGQLVPIEKDRLRSYQMAAAEATGNPKVVEALKWLEANPNDPRAPRARAALQKAIATVMPEPQNETQTEPDEAEDPNVPEEPDAPQTEDE